MRTSRSTIVCAQTEFARQPLLSRFCSRRLSHANELDDYAKALSEFKSIMSQRRAQINSGQSLPNLPGQALYLARNKMISAYKDLTDAVPGRSEGPTSSAFRRPTSTPTMSRCWMNT